MSTPLADRADDETLDLDPEQIKQLGYLASDCIGEYFARLPQLPVFPQTTGDELKNLLSEPLPVDGQAPQEILRQFEQLVIPGCRQNAHSRFWGYVSSPGAIIGAIADLISSALNQNVTSWRSAPAAAQIERLVIDWIKQMVDYPSDAGGLLVSGGSLANLSALMAASRAKAKSDIGAGGLRGSPSQMMIYASKEVHFSIEKAADILGFGRDSVRYISVDAQFKMDVAELAGQIEKDIEQGLAPFCVVGNAGAVNTGAMDPLDDLAEVCRKYDLWFHVDASYGGFAALAPSAKPLFAALDRADSLALDPHKWLYIPIDAGCILYKNTEQARRAFSHSAEYIRVLQESPVESFAFFDHGIELTRRFRALKIWMALKHYGARRLGKCIEADIRMARYLAARVEQSDDFELLAPVELSIVCFRYAPAGLRQKIAASANDRSEQDQINEQLNDLNTAILNRLLRGGKAYISNTTVRGKFALRACIINYRTRQSDIDILLDEVARIGAELAPQ